MKEQTLIEMQKKIQNLEGLVKALLNQTQRVKDISVGTLEILKRTDGYQEALDKLKEESSSDSGNEISK